jgi:hypothetical protein
MQARDWQPALTGIEPCRSSRIRENSKSRKLFEPELSSVLIPGAASDFPKGEAIRG